MLYDRYFIEDLRARADLVRRSKHANAFSVLVKSAFLILAFAQVVFPQDEPKAQMIDSFKKSSCEQLMATSDYLGTELQKASQSKGIVILYGNGGEDGRLADVYAQFLHRMLINKYGNHLDVSVLRSTSKPALEAEMWLVPKGASLDIPDSKVVAEIPFKVAERTLYTESSGDPCSNSDNFGFADLLLSNPNLTGVIVVRSWRRPNIPNDTEEILLEFDHLKVPRNRFRIFYKRVKRSPDKELGYWEMWLVPKKKR